MKSHAFDSSPAPALPQVSEQPSGEEYLHFIQQQRAQTAPIDENAFVFIAVDEKMRRIREIIDQIASANVPVLITGESGTGKEVVARAIHQASNRNGKPFVAVNCAALPANLLESELFGHEKGAFTSAHQRHIGKFEQADGGTLLLDEVTEIDPSLQAKLLRALQERQIERIGGDSPVNIDVRVIATTNRDIMASVAQGLFRQDLYYRLYVIHLEIPPLRERPKDIRVLADHYLRMFGNNFGKPGLGASPEAMQKLMAHKWPGNVRELQNVVQRAVLMCNGPIITAEAVAFDPAKVSSSMDWVKTLPIGRPMQDLETQFILETLRYHTGNRTHAARTLGISLRTLRNKINEFTAAGIEVTPPPTGKAL